MLRLPGDDCSDLCDSGYMTRRDLMRIGGAGFLGLTLGSVFEMQAIAREAVKSAPGWAKAKSIIMLYLQGGPIFPHTNCRRVLFRFRVLLKCPAKPSRLPWLLLRKPPHHL